MVSSCFGSNSDLNLVRVQSLSSFDIAPVLTESIVVKFSIVIAYNILQP